MGVISLQITRTEGKRMKRVLVAACLAITATTAPAIDQDLLDQALQRADSRGKERQWLYYEKRNRMTDEVTATTAELSPSKKHWAVISVDNRTDAGISVGIMYLAGELDCQATCSVLVRADEAPPHTFVVRHGGDWGDNAYLHDPKAFIDYVRNAKRILVQMRFTADKGNYVKGLVIVEYITDIPLEVRPLRAGIKPQ